MAEISMQTFVTFDDVAAYFSEDDWQCLEEWQQELYQNAMQEIHGVLLAMGYTISNPDVLVRIKNVGTSNFSDNPDSSKSKKCCNFTHDFPSHHPDILLRVKQQTHTLSSDQLELQEQSCTTSTLDDDDKCSNNSLASTHQESTSSSKLGDRASGDTLEDHNHKEQLPEKVKHNIVCWEDIVEKNEPKSVPKERPNENERDDGVASTNSAEMDEKISVSKERLFICSVCGKSFGGNSLLVRHMRIHTGEKPFACNHCDKSFNDKSYLLRHLRTHTGEKPYSCSVCLKCFSQNSSVMAHMRIHTGERPFQCPECEKRFSDKSYFVRHMRTHSGEKPYKCIQCEKCFSQTSSLTSHMRIHTGEKPYKCSVCGKCFSQNSSLAIHKRLHKPEDLL